MGEIMENNFDFKQNINDTLKLIFNRKSIRSFKDTPIEKEKERIILDAILRAPTAGNMMLYSVLKITDQGIKETLAKTCDNQPFIAKAPLVLIFLADNQRWFDIFNAMDVKSLTDKSGYKFRNPDIGDLFLAIADAIIAAQTSVIAAESLGITSCYIGDILENHDINKKLLNLPEYVIPVAMVVYGYPKGNYNKKPLTPRFDKKYIIFENQYKRFKKEELIQMLEPLKNRYFKNFDFTKNIKNMGQYFYLKKYISEYAIELNNSVRKYLENWLSN